MPIAVAAKISALLNGLTQDQLNQLSPAERQRFAALCHHWSQLVEHPRKEEPKSGLLLDLKSGRSAN